VIRADVLHHIEDEVKRVQIKDMQAEQDNIERTHKVMAEVFHRVYGDESDAAKEARHQVDQANMWMMVRNEEHNQQDMVDQRKKEEREKEQMDMRLLVKALDDKSDKRRSDFCRRAKIEMAQETRAQHDREDTKTKDRFNKSVEGRRANLHYDATHGDRLHWSAAPQVQQMDKDGDGVLTAKEVKQNLKEGGFSTRPGD